MKQRHRLLLIVLNVGALLRLAYAVPGAEREGPSQFAPGLAVAEGGRPLLA